MNRRLMRTIVYLLLSTLVFAATGIAEPVNQSFTLQPGWNAIFLEVEPVWFDQATQLAFPDNEPTDPEVVFAGLMGLESVWQWNSRTGTVEFIQNPDLLVPEEPQMLVYIPGNIPVTNLFAIQGNNAYLVHMDENGGNANLEVRGEPKLPRYKWKSNSFNFVGFHIVEGEGLNFEKFFESSPAHAGQEIYTLDNLTGKWVLTSPVEGMLRGEGFWIYCNGSSSFNGPVSVTLEQSSGLHFGKILSEQDIILHNNGKDQRIITMSLPPMSGDPMHYWVFDENDGVASWQPLPANLELTVEPAESQKIRLGVKRTGLVANVDSLANVGVSDDEGVNFMLPLSVTGIDYGGLWTGYATINKVSDVNKVDEQSVQDMTELSTGSEFDFRLIVHVEENGTVRLLSQVIQMWQEGTLKPDPDNLGQFVVDDPGTFVLFTDETLVDSFQGSLLRDGQQIGRRISAPAFPRLTAAQAEMAIGTGSAGVFPQPGHIREILINLSPADPTNPFYHMFHKTHSQNSIGVTRTVSLSFSDEDEDGNPITGLPSLSRGSSEVGGIYRETIIGLNKLDIAIEGTFVLHRVSNIATLTQ